MVYGTPLTLPGTFLEDPEPPGEVFQRQLRRAFDRWEPPEPFRSVKPPGYVDDFTRSPACSSAEMDMYHLQSLSTAAPTSCSGGRRSFSSCRSKTTATPSPLTASSRSSRQFQLRPRFLPGEAVHPSSGQILQQRPAGLEVVPGSSSLQPLSRPSLGGRCSAPSFILLTIVYLLNVSTYLLLSYKYIYSFSNLLTEQSLDIWSATIPR